MADSETEKKKKTSSSSSYMSLDCSPLEDSVSKLQLSTKKEHTLSIPDWSLLPEELLQLVSTHFEKKKPCFVDSIHARSVCSLWRSTFAFPSCLLPMSFPFLPALTRKSHECCFLKKIPMFLYRVKTQTLPCEFFLGGISRTHDTELPSPLQCSVKANLQGGSDPVLMNMLECQILPLGHRYRLTGKDPEEHGLVKSTGVALLRLNKEGRRGELVAILSCTSYFMVFRGFITGWFRYKSLSSASCKDLFTFKGKFFASFVNGETFVINPYSLEATRLSPPQGLNSCNELVPSSEEEELFLVEKTIPVIDHVLDFKQSMCRVSKLDEKTLEWIVVNDLGGRVLFIGELGNVACSSKELPDGCGLSGNSILFTNEPSDVTHVYKYRVETGNPEDDLGFFWRFSTENRVLLRYRSPPVVAFRIESDMA